MTADRIEEHKAECRSRYWLYANNGLCPRCSGRNKPEPGMVYCNECLEILRKYIKRNSKRFRKWHKNRYKNLKDLGLCVRCGREATLHGKSTCETCLAKNRQRYKEKQDAKRDAHI